ncbi:MAG TPA: HEAT repeat domain-containing protein [Pyrinomonadaceae bacterium]
MSAKKFARRLPVGVLLVAVVLLPSVAPYAQRAKDGPVKVTNVSARQSGDGTVVTISADAPLNRTQTWQDAEGFHLTLPNTGPGLAKGLPRGVTVRDLGRSLELVVAVRPGASITVQPRFNRLSLVVRNGGLDTTQGGTQVNATPEATSRAQQRAETQQQPAYEPPVRTPRERRPMVEPAPSLPYFPSQQESSARLPPLPADAPLPVDANANASTTAAPAPNAAQDKQPVAATSPQLVPAQEENISTAPTPDAPAQPSVSNQGGDGGLFSLLFSTSGVILVLVLGAGALFLLRKRRSAQEGEVKEKAVEADNEEINAETLVPDANALFEDRRKNERRSKDGRRAGDEPLPARASANARQESEPRGNEQQALEKRPATAPVQAALYGAYRVDQEVGKLVLGQAHRIDVLSSRAPDDRRAIETSLIKVMSSGEADDAQRRKACEALEEYGFVARLSAALLLAHEAYERASAARVLGEIGSPASLPFLTEALYDTEATVRQEAVASIGALRVPAAIGALLDLARRHPEMPVSALSKALTACSVECLDIFDVQTPEHTSISAEGEASFTGEITQLEPTTSVEELPEWLEDEELSDALARLQDTDVEARTAAARRLARFQVQRAVEALTMMAASDPESGVRSAAVTSLGEIEHESVFAPVLMAFADEAREVRAAAARSLSRMSFDRADAYVRLIETASYETLGQVSRACIKAGMATQAIDRLTSEDRRQAYESFSLLSMLAKSNETEPVLEAIGSHPDLNVRLSAVRLLGVAGTPEVARQLRQLAVRDGLPEKVRSALLEVVYKIDQAQPV